MTACYQCKTPLDERHDVRFDTNDHTFCSPACIFKYRGKQRLA